MRQAVTVKGIGRVFCILSRVAAVAGLLMSAVSSYAAGPNIPGVGPGNSLFLRGSEPAVRDTQWGEDLANTGDLADLWTGDWDHDWNLGLSAATPVTPGGSGQGGSAVPYSERDYLPDEVLSLNLTPKGRRAARTIGLAVSKPKPLATTGLVLTRLRTPQGLSASDALAALRRRDPQGFYDLNPVYRLASANTASAACRDVRCYPKSLISWGETCGLRTRIGMLDSAVDSRHPALASTRIRAVRLGPGAPSAGEAEHGTAVATLLAGSRTSAFRGLLPDAELVTADVFTVDGAGEVYTDAARMAAGLDWIAGQDPAAINISITGVDSGVLHTVIHRVVQAGIPVVAAVGNQGPDAAPAYPAAYDEVLAVTAVDQKLQIYPRANQGRHVGLAAPGVDVWTPGPDGAGILREGTSFAAPFVTAALAVLRNSEPSSEPASLSRELRSRAKHLGPPGDNPVFGAGLLQAGSCPAP